MKARNRFWPVYTSNLLSDGSAVVSLSWGAGPSSESESCLVNSLRSHGLYSPWNSPGQNTGVGSLSLLQRIFPTQELNRGLLHCRWILYQLSYEGSPKPGLSGVGFEPTPPGETAIWTQHLRSLVHLESKSSPGVIGVGKTCLASHMHTVTWWYSRHKGRIKATLEVGKPSSACEF